MKNYIWQLWRRRHHRQHITAISLWMFMNFHREKPPLQISIESRMRSEMKKRELIVHMWIYIEFELMTYFAVKVSFFPVSSHGNFSGVRIVFPRHSSATLFVCLFLIGFRLHLSTVLAQTKCALLHSILCILINFPILCFSRINSVKKSKGRKAKVWRRARAKRKKKSENLKIKLW